MTTHPAHRLPTSLHPYIFKHESNDSALPAHPFLASLSVLPISPSPTRRQVPLTTAFPPSPNKSTGERPEVDRVTEKIGSGRALRIVRPETNNRITTRTRLTCLRHPNPSRGLSPLTPQGALHPEPLKGRTAFSTS